jgi:AAA+ superfamily predicted ATPase
MTGVNLVKTLTTENSKNNTAKIKDIVKQDSYRKLVKILEKYIEHPKKLDPIKEDFKNFLP